MSNMVRFIGYDAAEAFWIGRQKNDYKGAVAVLRHKISASDLIHTLEELGACTSDRRFYSAVDALRESRLVEGLQWVEATPYGFVNTLESRFRLTAFVLVEKLIEEGLSLRLACATSAANIGFPGNSFLAAVKAVERIWREGQQEGGLDNDVAQLSNDSH